MVYAVHPKMFASCENSSRCSMCRGSLLKHVAKIPFLVVHRFKRITTMQKSYNRKKCEEER